MDLESKHKILVFLWQWWLARNKANARKRMACVSEICSSTAYHQMELGKIQNMSTSTRLRQGSKRKPPPFDYYKIIGTPAMEEGVLL